MNEFLGIGGYQRTPEGPWSWQHITFVSLLLIIMVTLAVVLGRLNRNKDEKAKNKVIIWAAILIDAVEIFKIVVMCVRSDDPTRALLLHLPLFLCSIQLIAIPLAAFTKGRLKESCLDFVFIFGILGAVLGTFGATQNYSAYPVLSLDNVASGLTHSISGFASLYIGFSGLISLKKKNIPITGVILSSFCVVAYVVNIIIDYNYMFLMNHDGTPYVILYNLVGGDPVLYPICVVVLFFVYASTFYGIHYLIKAKKSKLAVA